MRTVVSVVAVASVVVVAAQSRLVRPLDAGGRVTYYIADGEPGSRYRAEDRDLAVWALQAWERAIGFVRFVPAPEGDAMVRVYWVAAGDNLYGEMERIMVNGRPGAAVYIRPDTDALGPEIGSAARRDPLFRDTVVYLTCVHELGHALGLEHTENYADIMYFFGYGGDVPGFFTRYRSRLSQRTDIRTVPGLSPGDVERVRALYRAD